MKLLLLIVISISTMHFVFGHVKSYSDGNQIKSEHHQLPKKVLKPKKPRASIGFEDKSAITMLGDNPYFKSKSPAVTLNFGFRF